ncbi:primary-amine oxidase [Pendulispora brunnea]|uniref:Amine oxidase n=1 Tax=Pendulispora brunnea TaxID=2905690 RepID=A0ABZ2K808_9BACT
MGDDATISRRGLFRSFAPGLLLTACASDAKEGAVASAAAASAVTAAGHPLDPLSKEEIEATTAILRAAGRITPRTRVMPYRLLEPDKGAVLAAGPVEREIAVVLRDYERHVTVEATVSLTASAITRLRERRDVQPPFTLEEVNAGIQATMDDPAFQRAIRARGLEPSDVVLYPWTAGYLGPEHAPSRGRFLRLEAALRKKPNDNYYAHPIEGVVATIELDTLTVEIDDHGAVPVPEQPGEYTPQGIRDPSNVPSFPQGVRRDVAPLAITQPAGPGFEIDGHLVRWQKWRLRVGFSAREGIVLHQIEYDDRGRVRPILYRAALSEMYVPYGDASPSHNFKNVFDAGEVGIGVSANSLMAGCDCLGEIRHFDAFVNDGAGGVVTLKNAICMHEEDVGVQWKHVEFNPDGSPRTEVRRARRLVISSISTVGNYEYAFYWYLYQDGTIQFEVKLTGIMAPAAIAPGEKPISGTLVAPGVYGPNHQHYFNVRMDMMVDGVNNSVAEVNSEPIRRGSNNPRGNAWIAKETVLRSESEAQRSIEPRTARYWKVLNAGSRTAYKLAPGPNVFPMFLEGSTQWHRGGFARHHFWATAYDRDEMYAAGTYPNQQQNPGGLPSYVQKNRPLVDADLVIWYTFGTHHEVRPEDWPVMPVECAGFSLKPAGFFDGNPALDLPAPECHSH